jgi:hypothetical protein
MCVTFAKENFNSAVGQIQCPALQTQTASFLCGAGAEKNALHSTSNAVPFAYSVDHS